MENSCLDYQQQGKVCQRVGWIPGIVLLFFVTALMQVGLTGEVLGQETGLDSECSLSGGGSSRRASRRSLEHVLEAVGKVEHAPFAGACHDVDVSGRPQISLSRRSIPSKDSQGHQTLDLFESMLDRIELRNTQNRMAVERVKDCFEGDASGSSECRRYFEEALPIAIDEMRYHLALSQSPSEVATWMRRGRPTINRSLNSAGVYKVVPWSPLSKEEERRTERVMRRYVAEARAGAPSPTAGTESDRGELSPEASEALLRARYEHYQTYLAIKAQLPLVQFLSSADNGPQDFLNAAREMERHLEKETQKMDGLRQQISEARERAESRKGRGRGRASHLTRPAVIPNDLLDLLDYEFVLEDYLRGEEGKNYCALATSLIESRSHRQTQNRFAFAAPAVGIGFLVASPAMAVGAGVGAGVGLLYQSQAEFDAKMDSYLPQVMAADRSSLELESLNQAYRQRNTDLVLAPFGTGLGVLAVNRMATTPAVARLVQRLRASEAQGRSQSDQAVQNAISGWNNLAR